MGFVPQPNLQLWLVLPIPPHHRPPPSVFAFCFLGVIGLLKLLGNISLYPCTPQMFKFFLRITEMYGKQGVVALMPNPYLPQKTKFMPYSPIQGNSRVPVKLQKTFKFGLCPLGWYFFG